MKADNQLPLQMSCVMVLVKATLSKQHVQPKPVKPLYRLAVAAVAMRPLAARTPHGRLGVHDRHAPCDPLEQRDRHELDDQDGARKAHCRPEGLGVDDGDGRHDLEFDVDDQDRSRQAHRRLEDVGLSGFIDDLEHVVKEARAYQATLADIHARVDPLLKPKGE